MMPKLNTANPEVRDYLCGVGRYWIEEFGVDGWRLDVASEVDDGFWRGFPGGLQGGEARRAADRRGLGDRAPLARGRYVRLRHELRLPTPLPALLRQGASWTAAGFAARCGDMLMRYKKQVAGVQLNLLDSHDVPRFLTLCGGDKRRYKLAALFMFGFVGMPMLFYGDELGLSGPKRAGLPRPHALGRWRPRAVRLHRARRPAAQWSAPRCAAVISA